MAPIRFITKFFRLNNCIPVAEFRRAFEREFAPRRGRIEASYRSREEGDTNINVFELSFPLEIATAVEEFIDDFCKCHGLYDYEVDALVTPQEADQMIRRLAEQAFESHTSASQRWLH